MTEIEKLQAKIEELNNSIQEKEQQIEVLTAQNADYTTQIQEFEMKVNELEETNTLKSRKISDLLLNSASVIDNTQKQGQQTETVEDHVVDLDELIGGI